MTSSARVRPSTQRTPAALARSKAVRPSASDVHVLLWKSYLPPQEQTPRLTVAPGVPEMLKESQAQIPKPLLGIALWNQVPHYDGNAAAAPAALQSLLHTVLDLSIDDALRMYTDRNGVSFVFPPYPDQVIIDASYESHPSAHGCEATLQICVPADLEHVTCMMMDPHPWPCQPAPNFFWSRVQAPDAARIGSQLRQPCSIKADLSLPEQPVQSVTLRVLKLADNAFESQLKFEMSANRLLKVCHGEITVMKEEGRPGAVRIINKKAVQMAPDLAADAAPLVKYWLQAETVFLALPS